jgi:hypothetical protein
MQPEQVTPQKVTAVDENRYVEQPIVVPVYYLAGPMSGIPQFNYPKFAVIAGELRGAGFVIHSPPEQDSPAMQKAALANETGDLSKLQKDTNETWGDVLANDVKFISDKAKGVIVMDGWENSRGARLEVFTCNLVRKPLFVYVGEGVVRPMVREEYLAGITNG